MLEQLTEKLRVKGCHLLADIEYSDKSDYISGMIYTTPFCFLINYFYFKSYFWNLPAREVS